MLPATPEESRNEMDGHHANPFFQLVYLLTILDEMPRIDGVFFHSLRHHFGH